MLLAYYGDDFTGSTDVLESLAQSGIATMLFVNPPSEETLRRYPDVRAIGVAGQSRAMSPGDMETELAQVFRVFQRFRPAYCHYKTCSTFDSSPEIGSIGRAIDIGQRIFQNRFVPLVVAAPVLQRFCVFGNLFARSGLASEVYRLDRHPTMQRHPVTPMRESDLRWHLKQQTPRTVGLVDLLALEEGFDAASDQLARAANEAGRIVLFDALSDAHLTTIGKLLTAVQAQEDKTLFVVGSSGVEYALRDHWQDFGALAEVSSNSVSASPAISPVDRALIVSGSCSPVTARQIAWGSQHGFEELPLDTPALSRSRRLDTEISNVAQLIISRLNMGRSVILHTCQGSDDPRIAATRSAIGSDSRVAETLGTIMGRTLREVVRSRAVRRVAVIGGDTSGWVARSLGIDALELAASLEPGAPLCTARSRDEAVEGLEIVFKGGQVGYDDSFASLLRGSAEPNRVGR